MAKTSKPSSGDGEESEGETPEPTSGPRPRAPRPKRRRPSPPPPPPLVPEDRLPPLPLLFQLALQVELLEQQLEALEEVLAVLTQDPEEE